MALIIGAGGGLTSSGTPQITLPPPQALYPNVVLGNPQVVATNRVSLPPGGDILIPSGRFFVSPGQYSQIQAYDPVSGTWVPYTTATLNEPMYVESDGSNFRIINPTGFPVGAQMNANGSGYTSAPAVAANGINGSTWKAIVGGAISNINITTVSSSGGFTNVTGGSGAGYATSPIVNIAAPPYPGVQATAVASLNYSSGGVSAWTIINPGAGYLVPPACVLVTQPDDINLLGGTTTIQPAAATTQLSYSGQITAVLLTNEGNQPVGAPPVLSFTGGGGTGATATAVMAFTITGYTVSAAGSGYGTASNFYMTGIGGTVTSAAATVNNPIINTSLLIPRLANISVTAGSSTGLQPLAIIDGGLYPSIPTIVATPGPVGVGGVGSVYTATVGGVNDTVLVQPI
jgi:hypothetical protein